MTSSGTYNFQLDNADIILEAFDRCEIRPPAITGTQMVSAKRSLNLELQRWANLGVNLWAVELITINMLQGATTYQLPLEVVSMLDTYIRQYTLSKTLNVTPNYSIINGSSAVKISIANHGLLIGNFINIATPVSIGNLLLQGYYQVSSVIDANNFTITSPVAATSTVSNGGVVPQFTAVAGQASLQVTLPNHGEIIGEIFNVAVSTMVGGNAIYGPYSVIGVIDANNFGISTLSNNVFNDIQYENMGFSQTQVQAPNVNPVDYILTPLGRTDYAEIPDKLVQGRPTSYWQNRLINPTVTMWQVPDQNGPYQLQAYCMRRIQDADPSMGETPDIPYRFTDALCDQMALRLAMKYAKPMIEIIKPVADQSWRDAEMEDRERAQIMLLPDFSSYYR